MSAEETEIARQKVARFVARFDESYRWLAWYAALPLVLTPELLNYLRNYFLRDQTPYWEAEADLLLSELCRPVGYEQFAMASEVRAYLIGEMRERLGEAPMREVARLLIRYVRQLSRTSSPFGREALEAELWSAMVYLEERRGEAARQIAESFREQLVPDASGASGLAPPISEAALARLVRITEELASRLQDYPELLRYAADVGQLLASPTGAATLANARRVVGAATVRIADVALPDVAPKTNSTHRGMPISYAELGGSAPMPTPNDHRPIRILHLSDIHFRTDKAWDADPVLRALARFIEAEAKAGLVPDLVVITGDLAFAGVAEEYQLARDWLDQQLWPALPDDFSRDRLLLVPGNHDVDRKKVDFVAEAVQKNVLDAGDQNQIAKILGDAEQRDVLLKRHAAYLAFLSDWLGETQSLPWWQRPIEIRGVRLHVAGLDSAWMAWGNEDRGRLLLGRYQIHQTILHPSADDVDWRLALLHHPWDYFAEFDGHETRSTIHQHCDLLLRGHLHSPQTERVVPPDPSRACLELAAGCVYENSRYPNAFQWIELHSQPRRQIKVMYRIWIQGAWTIDRNQPGCPNGEADFPLPSNNSSQSSQDHWNRSKSSNNGKRTIPPKAIAAITESLDLVPALCGALAGQPEVKGTKPMELAKWLCAPDGDVRAAIRSVKAALINATKRRGDVSTLRERALDILGWMVITTVMEGYEREDAELAKTWFDKVTFEIPLGRNPCVEVLMARWRGNKAEFVIEKTRYGYGADDITPGNLQELGFGNLTKPETGRVVDYVQRLAYQRIFRVPVPTKLSLTQEQDLDARLDHEREEKNRRLQLVIDRNDPDCVLSSRAVIEAIHAALPQLLLIFIHSGREPDNRVFVVPPSKLASAIYGFLEGIEKLS